MYANNDHINLIHLIMATPQELGVMFEFRGRKYIRNEQGHLVDFEEQK